jgi:hypothetical protein
MMHVRLRVLFTAVLAINGCSIALCSDFAGFQRRCFMCAGLREPARLLYKPCTEESTGRRRNIVSRLSLSPQHKLKVRFIDGKHCQIQTPRHRRPSPSCMNC